MHVINKPATFFQEDLKFPLLGANRHLRLQCGGRFDSSFNFFFISVIKLLKSEEKTEFRVINPGNDHN